MISDAPSEPQSTVADASRVRSVAGAGFRYELLTPLRGLLALGVVVHHASQVDFGARFGRVVVFFVISGLCIFNAASREMATAAGGASGVRGAWRFLIRRALRLWPTFACAIAYFAIVRFALGFRGAGYRARQPLSSWVQNLTFTSWVNAIGDWTKPPWQNRSLLMGPHWTLGYEAQLYVLVAGAIVAGSLLRVRLSTVAMTLLVGGGAYVLLMPATWTATILDYAYFFGVGGCVWLVLTSPRWSSWRLPTCLGLAALAACWYLLAIGWEGTPATPTLDQLMIDRRIDWFMAAFAGTAAGALLLGLKPLDAWLMRVRGMKLIGALGVMSYSLFLVHPINAPIARLVTEKWLPASPPGWAWMGVYIAIQVAMGAAFWLCTERVFAKLLRREPRSRASESATVNPSGVPALP